MAFAQPRPRTAAYIVAVVVLPLLLQVLERVLAGAQVGSVGIVAGIVIAEWCAAAAVWVLLKRSGLRLRDIGFPAPRTFAAIAIGCGAVAVAAAIAGATQASPAHRATLVIFALAGAATGGIVEETLFRGVALGVGEPLLGSRQGAWILGALAFAGLHVGGGLPRVLVNVCFALVMSALYTWKRSLAIPMVVHWLFDVLGAVSYLR